MNKENGATKNILSSVFQIREITILLPLIAVIIVTGILNPTFLSSTNMFDLARSISLDLFAASAMTFMLISGNLDLSIGAVVSLGGVIVGECMVHGVPVILAIIIAMAGVAVVGLFNGALCVKLNIPSFITTMGTMYICKGINLIITKGKNVSPLPDSFINIVQGNLAGISYAAILAVLVVILFHYILRHTVYGRSVLAIGGNLEASRIAGLNTDVIRISIYILVSVMSGITGILLASRLCVAAPGAGDGKELSVVAGVIIGGTSIFGGVGTVIGSVIGIALIEVIKNALVMLRVSAYYQNVFIGAIMLLAVSFDSIRGMRENRV